MQPYKIILQLMPVVLDRPEILATGKTIRYNNNWMMLIKICKVLKTLNFNTEGAINEY